ncbi:hypothetical protein K1B30_003087 [Vibrio parahaemolyticus]|nr:hypothetical protein [Vibrio parahaemolyticus]EIU6802865.1 hypothetical protein [Vibrio parahaemolyticus]
MMCDTRNKHTPQKVGEAMVEGLNDYGKQTISALAQRDYDLGKFLFTASTFAILLSLTLVTALGKIYVFTLLSSIWFGKSVKISLKLVTDGAGDFNPGDKLLDDYNKMKKYIVKRVNEWYVEFNFGLKIFIIIFVITTIFDIAAPFLDIAVGTNGLNIESKLDILIDNICNSFDDESKLTMSSGD